ncbi:MAG TPA: hypothetical protein VHF44_01285 [Nitrososphaeraceae archaeon]|nr:hypothetical protein [Nitrososphaeraceae archaeon]
MTNDIAIHWKRITLGFANGRRWDDDRAPNIDGIRRLCEYSNQDVRICGISSLISPSFCQESGNE